MSAHTPVDEREISSLEQLEAYFLARSRPAEQWLIGTEYEQFGWRIRDGAHPPYEGARGIRSLLEAFIGDGWTPIREGDAIIALARAGATITLEPGGQLELSGAPLPTLQAMSDELDDFLAALRRHSAPLDLAWSGLGLTPVPAAEMPRMPKARYKIMRRYLPTKGESALTMMHCTGTVQSNFDFSDGADAMRKLRAALLIQPIISAVFANSPVQDREEGGVSQRSAVWLDTDEDRCRCPLEFYEAGQPLRRYLDWALQVPLFFIARDGEYLDCAGLPFQRFLDEGWRGHRATIGDFALHLSTLFPPARLKQQLEVRGADMGPVSYCKALPALHAGLLYDADALSALLDRFESISPELIRALEMRAPLEGLNASLAGEPLSQWAIWLLEIARGGLRRYEAGAEHLLDPVAEALKRGESPGDLLRSAWREGGTPALLAAARIV